MRVSALVEIEISNHVCHLVINISTCSILLAHLWPGSSVVNKSGASRGQSRWILGLVSLLLWWWDVFSRDQVVNAFLLHFKI